MFLFIILTITCEIINDHNYARIKNLTIALHAKTKHRTLYELFDVPEKSSISTIRLAYFNAEKYGTLNGRTPTRDEFELMSNAYSLLKKDKAAYDYVLDHPYIMTEYVVIENKKWMIIGVTIFVIILIDFVFTSIRRLRKTKDKKQKQNKKVEMLTTKIFRKISGVLRFFKRSR